MSQVRWLIIGFVLIAALAVQGQAVRNNPYPSEFPTENIRMNREANKNSNRPDRKKIDFLYTPDSYGILYGNPCAVEATRKMGFEYVVQPAGLSGSPTTKSIEWNNFKVKFKLFFTRSPFWKLILKKKIRDCGEKSGDIVG